MNRITHLSCGNAPSPRITRWTSASTLAANSVNQGLDMGLARVPMLGCTIRMAAPGAAVSDSFGRRSFGPGCTSRGPPRRHRLLWATRRRFDPSSSPSATHSGHPIFPSMNRPKISQ